MSAALHDWFILTNTSGIWSCQLINASFGSLSPDWMLLDKAISMVKVCIVRLLFLVKKRGRYLVNNQ